MHKTTTLLIALLLITTSLAGYMTYKNHQPAQETASVELVQSSEQLVALKTDNRKLSEQLVALKTDNGKLSEQLVTLKTDNGKLSEQLVTLKTDNGKLSEQLVALKTDNGKLSEQLVALKTDNGKLSEQLVTLKTDNGKLSEQLDALKTDNGKLSDQLVTLKTDNGKLSEQLRQDIDAFNQDITTLKQDMEVQLSKKNDVIDQLRDTAETIQLSSDVVFELGSTQLSVAGETVLLSVIKLIEKYPDYLINLEGHTDNIPISAAYLDKFPSNWELSAARAATAARFMESQGVDSFRLRVVGYGLVRPVADNSSVRNRAKNRRLEIRFSPKPRVRLTQ